jgi:hypothetical protein
MDLITLSEQPEPQTAMRPMKAKRVRSRPSRTSLVADYFRARPNRWIDGMVFAQFAGQYAWRSRIADARRVLGRIDNKQRRRSDGSILSLYRYVTEAK